MRAAVITAFGGPDVLQVQEVPIPRPAADQVLVRVYSSALNRADLLQRRGKYPAPAGAPQDIPGMEFAGEIAEIGLDVRRWRLGQRVFGICGGGAHAEYLVTHERMLVEVPSNLNWNEAASIPEVFITAHDALWIQAGLGPGERVLINAVGSGVGLAAVQLVRAIGAEPYGTARTQNKLDRAREFGMHAGWLVEPGANMAQLAGEQKFNVVLELAGGEYVSSDLELLENKGRLMLVGTVAGAEARANLGLILGKRLRIIGTMLRSRLLEEKIEATQAFAREVVPLLADGRLRPCVDSVYALDDIRHAHEHMEQNSNSGKIVITVHNG